MYYLGQVGYSGFFFFNIYFFLIINMFKILGLITYLDEIFKFSSDWVNKFGKLKYRVHKALAS